MIQDKLFSVFNFDDEQEIPEETEKTEEDLEEEEETEEDDVEEETEEDVVE